MYFFEEYNIKKLIRESAKYQKVLVIAGKYASQTYIDDIHELIKEDCIFNVVNLENYISEVNNGYKAIIYLLDACEFLSLNIEFSDFVNIIIPMDEFYFPYFTNKGKIYLENFVFLKNKKIDYRLFCSVYFSMFLNSLKSVLNEQSNDFINFIYDKAYTVDNSFNLLKENENLNLIDLDILSKTDICYKDLVAVDLILLDAIIVLINGVMKNNLMLIDLYKFNRENMELIDKSYKLLNDTVTLDNLKINGPILLKSIAHYKNEIKKFSNIEYSEEELKELVKKIKNYCAYSDDFLAYLYLYNVFDLK